MDIITLEFKDIWYMVPNKGIQLNYGMIEVLKDVVVLTYYIKIVINLIMGCVGTKDQSGKVQGQIKTKMNQQEDFDLSIFTSSFQKNTSK